MANATVTLTPAVFPFGFDATARRAIYDGVAAVVAGTYPAGGIPVLWMNLSANGMTDSLPTPYQLPAYVTFNGNAGSYEYGYSGYAIAQPVNPTIVSSFSITSNVATFIANNSFAVGQQVALGGFGTGTYFNSQVVTVASATGLQFTAAFTHANVTSTVDNGYAQQQVAFLHINPQAGVTNASATSTQFAITSNVATVTATNSFVAGETVLLQAFTTATYFNGVTAVIASATGSAYTFAFTHANVGTTADTTGTATRTDIAAGVAVPGAVTGDTIHFHAEFAKG